MLVTDSPHTLDLLATNSPAHRLPTVQVNMMQFTQIGPGRCLGNHFDRRLGLGLGLGLG